LWYWWKNYLASMTAMRECRRGYGAFNTLSTPMLCTTNMANGIHSTECQRLNGSQVRASCNGENGVAGLRADRSVTFLLVLTPSLAFSPATLTEQSRGEGSGRRRSCITDHRGRTGRQRRLLKWKRNRCTTVKRCRTGGRGCQHRIIECHCSARASNGGRARSKGARLRGEVLTVALPFSPATLTEYSRGEGCGRRGNGGLTQELAFSPATLTEQSRGQRCGRRRSGRTTGRK
jgi:hypothetical protein